MNNEEQEKPFQAADPEKDGEVDIKAIVMTYLMYWPQILVCVIAAMVIGWLYLAKTAPTYQISASVLIKNDDQKSGGASSSDMLAGLQNLGMFSMVNNFDNEVEILNSRTLVQKVVEKLDLYVDVTEKQGLRTVDLYGNSPLKVWATPKEMEKMGVASIKAKLEKNGSLEVEALVGPKKSPTKQHYEYKKRFNKLPAFLSTPYGIISFQRIDSVPVTKDMDLEVNMTSPHLAGLDYKGRLSVTSTSKQTTIAQISFNDVNTQRGQNFVNALVDMYNEEANKDKNEVAEKTAEFINNRILLIARELGSTENSMAGFKRRAGLTDVTSDMQMALTGRADYEKQCVENETQLRLINELRSYLRGIGNENEPIPSSIGIETANDQGLSQLVSSYNLELINRNRLARNSSEKSSVIQSLDNALANMRRNILLTVNSVEKGARMAQARLKAEASRYSGAIGNAPEDEKEFLNISRQRDFQSQLYLLLMQKREENALKLSATANNGRIIDEAEAGLQPISPKKPLIYLISLILGIAIPVGFIYLRQLLRFKIEDRSDIEKITNLPIVGDVPFEKKTAGVRHIMIHENKNELMEEIFRNIRTNVSFLLGNKKVILLTSSISGEGKSTIAGNLAASYAFLGKKVVIVGLDIRKPGLNKVFKISTRMDGISQYLAYPDTTDLMSLVQPSNVSPNLFVLPGGTVPPNPTELVARPSLDKAIDILKQNFDIIILDTAPIGFVTDTQIIARVAETSLYVCCVGKTPKAAFSAINELDKEHKLPHIAIVVNGIDMNKRSSGYYYGYGKYGHYGKYGYGKKYGYGYGYGYKEGESRKTFWQKLFKK